MSTYTLPNWLLYAGENPADLHSLAAELQAEHNPSNEAEFEIFDRIVIASWLRKRYEKVRSNLYDRKNALAPSSRHLPVTLDSIRRFQQEVDQQKKQLATLRKNLRKLRDTGNVVVEESFYEYLPAA